LTNKKKITEVDDEDTEEAWLVVVDTPPVGVVIVVAGVEDETWVGVGVSVPAGSGNN
jgi:hypothetical protein